MKKKNVFQKGSLALKPWTQRLVPVLIAAPVGSSLLSSQLILPRERQVDGGAVSPDNSRGAVLPFLVARRCLAPTDWPEQFAFPSGCSKKYAMK